MILNKNHYKVFSFFFGTTLFVIGRVRALFNNERNLIENERKLSRLPELKFDGDDQVVCDSCFLCVTVCPTKAIHINGDTGQSPRSFQLNVLNCIECSLCLDICPVQALQHGPNEPRLLRGEDSLWRELRK